MRSLALIAFLLFIVLSLSFALAMYFGYTDEGWYQQWLSSFSENSLALASLMMLLLAIDLFLPIPSSLVMSLAGAWLGFELALVVNFIGSMASAVLGFALCRHYGQAAFQRLIGEQQIDEVRRFFNDYGIWAILLSRSVPMLTEIISCLAGLGSMSFRRFLLFSAAGCLPVAIVYAWLASQYGLQNVFAWAVVIALILPACGYAILRFSLLKRS